NMAPRTMPVKPMPTSARNRRRVSNFGFAMTGVSADGDEVIVIEQDVHQALPAVLPLPTEEMDARLLLWSRGRPAENGLERRDDKGGVQPVVEPASQAVRLPPHPVAVDQRQRLLRHDALVAPVTLFHAGRIE